jgi:hypothetical protein
MFPASIRLTPRRGRWIPGCFFALFITLSVGWSQEARPKIDRQALVTRHNPHLTAVNPWAPLSVGNGQFAFTADVTGLQTFYDHYQKNGIPLETLARWAWHSNANPKGYKLSDANRNFTAYGKTLGYPMSGSSPAGLWLRENPHDMPLGQLGFVDERGAPLELKDISDIDQTLDLWTGELRSRFKWRGMSVAVSTVAAGFGFKDGIAVRVISPAIANGSLRVRLAFPRGHDIKVKNNPALDWSLPETHSTTGDWSGSDGAPLAKVGRPFGPSSDKTKNSEPRTIRSSMLHLQRARDDFRYLSTLRCEGTEQVFSPEAHVYIISGAQGNEELGLSWQLAKEGQPRHELMHELRDWSDAKFQSAKNWKEFWQSGAALDLSGSKDPRAAELERRVVLSQYLTAIQFYGDFPPQESGLTNSTWYGKHHTEMIWWHTAHFALWGRDAFLAKNLRWYVGALPIARDLARSRGLTGARWAKMIGPDGRESPGGNPLIIWNQPHPIHLAELLYRNSPTPETLAAYRELVLETAEGMASMLNWDEAKQRYNLGPPMWIAQEIYDQATSMNPTYEISYWVRGLTIAQEWRERLKLGRNPEWDKRIKRIAALPVKDGKYVAIESTPDTWDNKDSRHDHPSFLMALGQLPGDKVDRATMRRTLDAVLANWDWETKIWGWDYPMIAMTAARLGEPGIALDIILKNGPNNAYTANGHNPQRQDLPVYLPGNGSLLAAVAMMAGGWDNAPTLDAPGFPRDGSWTVRAEGFRPLP